MTAKAIISSRLFKQFLTISGLNYVVGPICDWILERRYPARLYPIEAQAVRAIAKETGLDCFPLLLSQPQQCPTCGEWVGLLVQPEKVCFYCWPDSTSCSK